MTQLLTGTSWKRVRDIVKSRDGETCQYCNAKATDGEADHVLPLSKGGHDGLDNLVWSCQKCNREKAGKTLREWICGINSNPQSEDKVELPHIIDETLAGWECDCGGCEYAPKDGEVVIEFLPHGHHAPDCTIMKKWNDGDCNCHPDVSKVVNGEIIALGAFVYL